MSAKGGRRPVTIAALVALLVGGTVYAVDSGPLWPGVPLLAVLAGAVAGGLLARRPRDVLAAGTGAFAGVWLEGVARGLEPGAPSDLALLGLVPAAFFGSLVLGGGYAAFLLLVPFHGRASRLGAAAAIGVGATLAWVALVGSSPASVESYRLMDPQTMVVAVLGAPHGWTRISGVAESASSVAVSARTTVWLPGGAGTADLERVELTVRLGAPLGGRTVTDESGEAVRLVAAP